jgi:uncharacterized protein YjbI with pentapeptide repeats
VSERSVVRTAGSPRRAQGQVLSPALKPHERTIETDKDWIEDVSDAVLSDHVFERVSAKTVHFKNVDFKYCVFDGCYLRLCDFDSCDFTGCKFVGSNFYGSTFVGCKFDYAVFERTLISSDILDTCCPSWENLKLRFARTLRMNYQALGDSDAVNKAVLVELDATRAHLSKAWRSNESYYRKKYSGAARLQALFNWMGFVAGDVIWGNGERPLHLVRTTVALLVLLAILDTLFARDARLVTEWISALAEAPQVFLGTEHPNYPGHIVASIALARYVILGLFVSILVRRFARR